MDFTSSFPILVKIVLLLNIPDPSRSLRTSLLIVRFQVNGIHRPEVKREIATHVFKAPWHTICKSSKKATNRIMVATCRAPSYTQK